MLSLFKKRNLYLLHRWLGIGLCIFFMLWFVSGVVMLYTRMPLLYPSERYAGLPPLNLAAVTKTPQQAWQVLGTQGVPSKVRLVMSQGRPVYFFQPKGQKWQGVYGDDGTYFTAVNAERGAKEAERFSGFHGAKYVRTFDGIDQWTFSNSLNLQRPLHRYYFDDSNRTEVYVSQVTGEVVNVTTAKQRLGAAVGSYVHWLAPEFFRRESSLWRNTLLVLCVLGVVSTASGLIVGVLRWRRQGYPNRKGIAAKLPYRGVMAWHVWAGLIFGTATLTWILSALLYMNPGGSKSGPLSTVTTVTPFNEGGIRANTSPHPEQVQALSGGPLALEPFETLPSQALSAAGLAKAPKEIELVRFAGRSFYLCAYADQDTYLATASGTASKALPRLEVDLLVKQARLAVPGAKLVRADLLTEYDAYYYAVGDVAPKRLPMLRVQFDDPGETWLYINPHTGTVFRRYDRYARLMRWLVNGLHCLDFPILIKHRPLWDIAVIGLSLGGFVLSGTAVVTGGRRLRQEVKGRKTRRVPAAAGSHHPLSLPTSPS